MRGLQMKNVFLCVPQQNFLSFILDLLPRELTWSNCSVGWLEFSQVPAFFDITGRRLITSLENALQVVFPLPPPEQVKSKSLTLKSPNPHPISARTSETPEFSFSPPGYSTNSPFNRPQWWPAIGPFLVSPAFPSVLLHIRLSIHAFLSQAVKPFRPPDPVCA